MMDDIFDFSGVFAPLAKPESGIGWTPDRFRLEIWYPNCGMIGRPIDIAGVHTWEQATEHARRLMADAHDPVFWIRFVAVDPISDRP